MTDDIEHDDDEPLTIDCPACGGEAMEIGLLGSRRHYRCRSCGVDSSIDEGARRVDGVYVEDEEHPADYAPALDDTSEDT